MRVNHVIETAAGGTFSAPHLSLGPRVMARCLAVAVIHFSIFLVSGDGPDQSAVVHSKPIVETDQIVSADETDPRIAAILNHEQLTLADCVWMASINDEAIAIAREKLEQARADRRLVRASVLPEIQFEGDYIEQSDIPGVRDDDFGVENERVKIDYFVSVSQPIFSGFKNTYADRAIRAVERAREASVLGELNLVALEVVDTYFENLLIEKEIEILRQFVELQRRQVSDMVKRVRIGDARLGEQLLIENDLAEDLEELSRLEMESKIARNHLSHLIGYSCVHRLSTPNYAHERRDRDQIIEGAIRERPDLIALSEVVRARFAEVKFAMGDFFPDIDLNFDYYTRRDGFQDNVDWDLKFMASMPLFAGGSRLAELSKAKSVLREAKLQFRERRREVISAIDDLLTRIERTTEIIAIVGERIKLTSQTNQQVELEYQAGVATTLERLQAKTRRIDAEIKYEKEQLELQRLYLHLRLAAGSFPFCLGSESRISTPTDESRKNDSAHQDM